MSGKPITQALSDKIITYYLDSPKTIKDVCRKFNLSVPTIIKILKNTHKYHKTLIKNPNLNETFFENIDSEEKAYFVGIMISDGNVFIEENNIKKEEIFKAKEEMIIEQSFPNTGYFATQETYANIWKHFCLSPLRG